MNKPQATRIYRKPKPRPFSERHPILDAVFGVMLLTVFIGILLLSWALASVVTA
jgi:hypothetical protein